MNNRLGFALLGVCVLAGCKSIEGTYYPGCVAFAGDKVVLENGRFEWDRFTDEVLVDERGNEIDQFPGYPKRGTYRIDGGLVRLTFEPDGAVETMQVRQRDGGSVLLTAAQADAFERTGRHDQCALTREADETD